MSDFRVGDRVYCLILGEAVVRDIYSGGEEFTVALEFIKNKGRLAYSSDGRRYLDYTRTLFHLNAISFDDKGRPTSIDWEYKPKRLGRDKFEEKVKDTKLPQDFVEGEEILHDSGDRGKWDKGHFRSATEDTRAMYRVYSKYGCVSSTPAVIPYKGNEHMEGKPVTCGSGRMSEYYAARKKPECGHRVEMNVREDVKEIIDQEVAKIDFEKLAKKYVKKKYYISPEEWFWVVCGVATLVNNNNSSKDD